MAYADFREEFLFDLRARLRRFVEVVAEALNEEELEPHERFELMVYAFAALEDLEDEFFQMVDPEYRPSLPEFPYRARLPRAFVKAIDEMKQLLAAERVANPLVLDSADASAWMPPGFKPATKLDEFQFDRMAAGVGKRKRKPVGAV